ncbi:uncharacterized protein ARMOST_05828 [Armillaria ostoyae]|uniref:Uncharacterized protein n=1 Tax=Armillaria ostoyae TaxID=47428 RepID=A0A284R1A9_ARMOS|nr:uncharacterized protein ARMOST_05828 [Armillaria ostoyae]
MQPKLGTKSYASTLLGFRKLRIEASMPQDDTVNITYRPPSTTLEEDKDFGSRPDTRFEEAVRRCYFRTSIQTLNKAKPGRTFSIKTVLNSRGIGSEALPFDKCCPRPVQHSATSATSQ